jgi:UDP-N-acetylglucosamine 2-epimerase (non-hydrolysing)
MKNKILICFGTRPEWLKIKPLIKLLDKSQYYLLFTGQHPDLLKSVDVDFKINMTSTDNRLDQIISDCMTQFPTGDFNSVLVQGDTGSAFGCALAAFNRQLKIYYMEAGLRSHNLRHPYPEEGYRQMISRISDINFCPTELSKSNLLKEGALGEHFITGNTVLDNLIEYKTKCEYTNKILITLHRRENHHLVDKWFTEINNLAIDNPHLEFIIPLHPNPNVQKHKHLLTHVNILEPLQHSDLLDILVKCKLVISDSGGLQEEGSFFNKKVIVCRETTERPEAIDTGHLFLCSHPNFLSGLFGDLIENYYINTECPYGDGYSSQKIHNYLTNE